MSRTDLRGPGDDDGLLEGEGEVPQLLEVREKVPPRAVLHYLSIRSSA